MDVDKIIQQLQASILHSCLSVQGLRSCRANIALVEVPDWNVEHKCEPGPSRAPFRRTCGVVRIDPEIWIWFDFGTIEQNLPADNFSSRHISSRHSVICGDFAVERSATNQDAHLF